MMVRLVRVSVGLLGLAAVVIGAMIYLAGPDRTATLFGWIIGWATGSPAYSGGLDSANIDSEMRFYAVFWVAYGAILLREATRPALRSRAVYLCLALFFLAGLGRILSALTIGSPDPLFVILTWVELILPAALALAFAVTTRPAG